MLVEPTVERPTSATPKSELRRPNHPHRRWIVAAIACVVVLGAIAYGVVPRVRARQQVRSETAEMALSVVSVVHPEKTAPSDELVLPANVQPYISAPIYARTNGYLKGWYADIGTHVRKGQLLAEIETPELDQQLQQARANLNTAQANLQLSEITANRYQGLLKTNSVAQQDADNAVGANNANKAIVQSNQANVRQLEQLQAYEKIYAPFDGIITVRNTDIGALINSGSSSVPNTELFHIAQPNRLRVYVDVPEAYAPSAKPGLTAELTLAEYPGRRFQGRLVRTAEAINLTTRTLQVEIAVDNPTGTLLSGSYAEVHMKVPAQASAFLLPVSALMFRSEGLRVVTVGEGNRVQLRQVTPGHDFGDRMEILAGLNANDSVIVNPPDSIVDGEQVRVATPAPQSGQQAQGAAQQPGGAPQQQQGGQHAGGKQ
ncbi:MAG TPA: efflux RND transporter periplasmic adaptor subunit [Terriglobales bacterium]|nr:efflux RND transporter periplasmic adaptor subunit [Terriglobales bacterium]